MTDLLLNSNKLSGEIPSSICNLKFLQIFDLSNNSLDGSIPDCLGNLRSLQFFNLRKNSFQGLIPTKFTKGCSLESLKLTGNNLEGTLPQSLVNCGNLQVLDVGNNRIQDKFPFWTETLPHLRVLILRSNMFNGTLFSTLGTKLPFPRLQVFDISGNAFTGSLPLGYLINFRAMMDVKVNRPFQLNWVSPYEESVTLILKGLEQTLERILIALTTIDLSSNNFSGSISNSIGKLNSLIYLNLSQNCLMGNIPASLGNVSALESLDLSSNQLVGEIPAQLTKLTFLSVLDLSMNKLSGKIPSKGQFSTFENTSYVGNSGLCGFPLTHKCEDGDKEQPSPQMTLEDGDDSYFLDGFCWQAVVFGYGPGFVIGGSMGYFILPYGRPKWLVEWVYGINRKRRSRGSVARRRRT